MMKMTRRPCPDMRPHREAVEKFIFSKIAIQPNGGCWVWTGHCNALGYAEGTFARRTWILTRLVYCATQGGFNPKLDICHTCDNPSCVNPLHLWLGTRSANIRDSVDKGRHFLAEQTHCKRGHPLSGKNLYISYRKDHQKRHCVICQRAKTRMQRGWPEDLAYTLPVRYGWRPEGLGSAHKRLKGRKTHCVNGHPLSGDNLYVVPSDGRRQCRTCKLHVTLRLAAERRAHNGNG
jgi:hypothetical protein